MPTRNGGSSSPSRRGPAPPPAPEPSRRASGENSTARRTSSPSLPARPELSRKRPPPVNLNHPSSPETLGCPMLPWSAALLFGADETQRRQTRRPHPPHGARGIQLLAEGDRTPLSARSARLWSTLQLPESRSPRSGSFVSTPTSHSLAVVAPHRCVPEHTDMKIFVDNLKVEIPGRLSSHSSQPLNTFSTAAARTCEDFS
jgi:hypothetical protein